VVTVKEYQPEKLKFLTDGGSENVNHIVSNFINSPDIPIKHIVAQKDVVYSNSMIEAINKIIKHQFLHPKEITNGNQLTNIMTYTILIYNTIRPQMSLGGNTPKETRYCKRSVKIAMCCICVGYKKCDVKTIEVVASGTR
jgi:putative transposase